MGDEEVLLEEEVEMEAEEVEGLGDLSCQKNYEEPESCGSAADFLLGMEMEEDLLGREEVEGGSHDVFFKLMTVINGIVFLHQ